jgi:preprotein translocase SecE subunit
LAVGGRSADRGRPWALGQEGIAMAVAVKKSPEATSSTTMSHLAFPSLVGMVYVLVSLYLVFSVLPHLWWDELELPVTFVNVSLLLVSMLAVAAGLALLGKKLLGPDPPHGLKAGIFTAILLTFVLALLVQMIGVTAENWFGHGVVGLVIGVVVSALVVFFLGRPFFRTSFVRRMARFEDQNWFTTHSYKPSQGQRVRRGTILGILVVAASGIYTLLRRNPLFGDWQIEAPFVDDWYWVLLPYQRYTLPLLIAVGALWIAWRVVNFPPFADFLIATEAEMNKVSWTTRKRLVQDTIVVLTTVVLMTLFLFFVDILWFKILNHPLIKVIRVDTTAQQTDSAGEKNEY